jgi:hypothetical protein
MFNIFTNLILVGCSNDFGLNNTPVDPAVEDLTEAAPAEEPETETVYGAFDKKFGADPIGSQRVSGKLYLKDATTGNFYLAPDQSARAEGTTLTAGGGPNAFKAFAEEVRARREANIARRGLSKEDGAKAPLRSAAIGLAQDLTPTRQTPAEEARAVEYSRQQEMERRAIEQVATEAPTSQREAVLRAQQAWDTANADQGFLGREFYDGVDKPISAVPGAPYTPQATLPNIPAPVLPAAPKPALAADDGLPMPPARAFDKQAVQAAYEQDLAEKIVAPPFVADQRTQILNPRDYIRMGPETGRNMYIDRKKVEFDPNRIVSPRESGSMRAPTYTAPEFSPAPTPAPAPVSPNPAPKKAEKSKPKEDDARAAPLAPTLTPDQRARQERVVKEFYKMPLPDQRGTLLKGQKGPTYGQTPAYRDSLNVPTASSLE